MNATSPDCSAPINWRLGLLLFLAVLALSIPQAALLPLLDRDEPRFAEASREMLQSGNYVVPTFNGAPRYAKPPLIYWCQTISYRIFGENAFAARLPSLLATAATALLLATWGMRLGSDQMGLGAGLLYALCLQTVQQGRVATADALLIFFMTLTAFAGWKIIQPKISGRVPVICFVVLALGFAGGFLAKGPEALLPLIPLVWCARKSGQKVIVGIVASFLIGLAIVLIWAVPAYIQSNGDYWKEGLGHDVFDRAVGGNFQGHGASSFGWYLLGVPLYLLLFWPSALPWSPLLVIHRKKLSTDWKPDLTDSYLLLNAALIFLVFSLMVTKLPHYTLPAFPFLALLFARRWSAIGLPPRSLTKLGWVTGIAFTAITCVAVPIAIANGATPSPVGQLVRAAGDNLKPDTQFALVDFQEPNAVWEMRRVANGYGQSISESGIATFMSQPGSRAVILSDQAFGRFQGNRNLLPWKFYSAHGFNAAKGSFIDLTLVVKP
jgi:4-amino-4-deoxy-L-arabinose transferase-like glycosyltransferase